MVAPTEGPTDLTTSESIETLLPLVREPTLLPGLVDEELAADPLHM